jgi:hypothetical protein
VRKRLSSITRRSLVGALVGLAFAAAAGVGLAQITAGSTPSTAATSTTESQTTSTPTTGDREGQSADDENSQGSDFESESDENGSQSSTTLGTFSTTAPLTTTGGDSENSGAGQEKMDVCHQTGNGGEHTINIAAPAVPAHKAHGDTVGPCDGIAATTSSTTTAQATTQSTTTTAHGQKPKKPKGHITTHTTAPSSGHGNSNHGSSGHGTSGHAGNRAAGGSSHGNSGHGHGGGKGHGK